MTGRAAVIHGAADVIPDGRLDLPFVEQARRAAVKDEGRINGDRLSSPCVDIEQDFARGALSCGGRLPARFRPFHDNRAGRPQPVGQLVVNDSISVGHAAILSQGRSTKRDIVTMSAR